MNRSRKKMRTIVGIAVTFTVLLVLTACPTPEEDDSVSIDERVNAFISDVNAGNYTSLYTHLHPESQDYTQARTKDTWVPSPFADGQSYTLGTLTISGSTVTTTISGGAYSSNALTFNMKEDGRDVWKILSSSGAFTIE